MPLKFLHKGVKRIYRNTRKLAKKVPNEVWIAAAGFFALGVGTVGFSAFKDVSSLGGFFGAVGRTTLAGAQGLAGSFGIGQGVSPGLDEGISGNHAGATIGSAWGGTGNVARSVIGDTPEDTANGQDERPGSEMAWAAIASGAQYWLQSREYKKLDKREARRNFFGGPARGGDPNLPFKIPSVVDRGTVLGDSYDPGGIFSELDSTKDLFDELDNPIVNFRGFG